MHSIQAHAGSKETEQVSKPRVYSVKWSDEAEIPLSGAESCHFVGEGNLMELIDWLLESCVQFGGEIYNKNLEFSWA